MKRLIGLGLAVAVLVTGAATSERGVETVSSSSARNVYGGACKSAYIVGYCNQLTWCGIWFSPCNETIPEFKVDPNVPGPYCGVTTFNCVNSCGTYCGKWSVLNPCTYTGGQIAKL